MDNSPSQLHLIYKLESMRQIILNTADKNAILKLAQKVYDITFPVPIDLSFKYKIEGKERTLFMLANEIHSYEKSNTEIEVVQFQFAATILMLMLQFIEGSLEQMNELIVH